MATELLIAIARACIASLSRLLELLLLSPSSISTPLSPAMSWQAYVDDHLLCPLPSGHSLTSAAIIGVDGSVWASNAKFPQIKDEEMTAIVNAFTDSSALAQSGLFIGGTKYFVLQGEQGVVIRGKKGSGGVTIKKTALAVVIGIYDEPVTPPECNTIVERLGDYLIEQGC